MAENSLGVKTDEIYERRNEKGKEMQNYQDAEKQLLAIQAAQQQNLNAARTSNLAQYQNNQNLAAAGDVLNQTQQANTQQVTVNPTTQQILQKYGATKPGTITKTTHSQQVTKQNITINNNTTTTTNNQVTTPPPQPQVVRPQRDNSSEKFKIWLNNTLARQQEDYARREKDYDKRESALTRDSNKMLRKLGEFSKDMMEKMDPRKIGSTATSQIKTLLFMFGFQYLASNWTKILKTVASIEGSFKRGLAYFGLYNLKSNGSGSFCFKPGESQFALDIYGLFSGNWKVSSLLPAGSSGGNSGITPLMGGENGFVGGLRKVLLGDQAVGGKDKGLIEIIKEFFVNQGKKRMAAAKMIETPDFNVGDLGSSIKNLGDYLGQLLGIFLGDPEEALREKIASKMSIDSAHRSWNKIERLSTGNRVEVYTSTDNKTHEVEQGIRAYTKGSQKGLSLRSLDSNGELIADDAEGMYSQASDLNLAYDEAEKGDEIDTGRFATGFYRLYQAAKKSKRKRAPVPDEFINKYLTPEEREKLIKSGEIKRTRYNYVVRKVKATDDTGVAKQDHWYDNDNVTDSIWWGLTGTEYFEKAAEWGHELVDWARKENTAGEEERLVLVPEGDERGDDLITESSELLYEISPSVLDYIVNRYNSEDSKVNIDITDENYFKSMNNFATTTYRKKDQDKNPDKYKKTYTVDYENSNGDKKQATLNHDEYQLYKNKGVYIGSDKDFAEFVNKKDYRTIIGTGDTEFDRAFQTFQKGNKGSNGVGAAVINNSLKDLDFNNLIPDLEDYGNASRLKKEEFNPSVGWSESILHGLSSSIIAVNPNNPKESIDLSKIDKNMSSEQLHELYNKVKDWDFNYGGEGSKLVKGKNSNLKKQVIDLLKRSLEAHYTGEKSSVSGVGMVSDMKDAGELKKKFLKEVDDILSDPEVIEDPDALSSKLTSLLDSYSLNDSWFTHAKTNNDKIRRKSAINSSNERRIKGENEVNNILAGYARIVDEVDSRVAGSRREIGLNALSDLILNRQQAEGEFNRVTEKVNRYQSDPAKVTIDADDLDAEGSNQYNDYFYGMNNWKKENKEREDDYAEDINNNAAASTVRDTVNSISGYLSGVKETFEDYSDEAKGKLNSLFNNAKDVVNDFLRNLDYTKVSLSKWPENTLITKESGLLLWWAFNNGTSNVHFNFRVKGASGRFGAGRNNSEPFTRLHNGRSTFDRVHSGQDISDFVVSGNDMNAKKFTLYAPFNCKVLKYRDKESNPKSGRWILVQQTSGDSNTEQGRFKMFVCHLSEINNKVKTSLKSGETISKGDELGKMGGSGYVSKKVDSNGQVIEPGHWSEEKYGKHFHVNFLDTENPGPFDGPFDKPVVGTDKFYGFAKSNSWETNLGAIDPLFVFCDDKGDNIKNRTLYLSAKKTVVQADETNPQNHLSKDQLADLGNLTKGSGDSEDNEENPDNENGEGKDNRPFLEKAWDWLKDMAFKIKMEYLNPSLDSLKSSKEDFLKLKQGQVGMSFAKSSYSYSGQVTPEFVNYQNYLKNAGKIGLGPDGQPLTEAEWRNQVFDMTGSDPVALKLGEYLNHGVAVKSANQLSNKDTKETISKYSETNNTENTVNNIEGSTGNGEVSNVAITNSMEEGDNNTIVGDVVKFIPNTDGFFGNKTLTDLQNEGKPFYNLEKKGDLTNERLLQINKILLNNREFMAKISDTVLAAFDRQAGLTVAGMGNKKPNVTVANTVTGTGSSNVN